LESRDGTSRRSDDEEIRRKIERLRLVLLGQAGAGGATLRPGSDARSASASGGAGLGAGIHGIKGAREVASRHGKCLLIEKDLDACPSPDRLVEAYRVLSAKAWARTACTSRAARLTRAGRSGAAEEPGERPGPCSAASGDLVFLDLETTGLSATPLFLAGMLFEVEGRMKGVQLLARDYSEERCLIAMLDELLGARKVCITFNGKSFDVPYLKERAKYHRLALSPQSQHLDLLHHARRRWKHHLPDCRLLTLELHVLGRRRSGDVGGWEVPCIYHDFVHTRDAGQLKHVLRHNLMDVLAMAELLVSLAEA
jgi:uncharacterized protein YprB with RNaseH-like and TPR domain